MRKSIGSYSTPSRGRAAPSTGNVGGITRTKNPAVASQKPVNKGPVPRPAPISKPMPKAKAPMNPSMPKKY